MSYFCTTPSPIFCLSEWVRNGRDPPTPWTSKLRLPTTPTHRHSSHSLWHSCKKKLLERVRSTHKTVIFNEKQHKIEQYVSTRTRHLSGTLIAEPDTCLEHCLDSNNTYTNYSCGNPTSVDPLPPVTIHFRPTFDLFIPLFPRPLSSIYWMS